MQTTLARWALLSSSTRKSRFAHPSHTPDGQPVMGSRRGGHSRVPLESVGQMFMTQRRAAGERRGRQVVEDRPDDDARRKLRILRAEDSAWRTRRRRARSQQVQRFPAGDSRSARIQRVCHEPLRLAVRGESPAAFERRCIPPGYVASRSNTAGMLPRRALPDRRIATLGATRDFHHGLLGWRLLKNPDPTRSGLWHCRPASDAVVVEASTRRHRTLDTLPSDRCRAGRCRPGLGAAGDDPDTPAAAGAA